MSFLHNEIYDEIPKEILNTDTKKANEFVSGLIKSVVPTRDYCPEEFSKGILMLKKYHRNRKKQPRKKPFLSRKERNRLKLLKCPKTGWNYEEFEPLRQLWRGYMNQNLSQLYINKNMETIIQSSMSELNTVLARSDYHGAEIEIIKAKNPSLVGISGTCIIDTKNTLKILSEDNKCRTVPKVDCVFQIKIKGILLTIYGKYMTTKPAERSAKKIKSLMIPVL